MPRRLSRLLARVHKLARAGKVRFTHKALYELASLDLGLDERDALDILTNLTAEEWVGRVSSEHTDEWMHIFKPAVAGSTIYVKLILRAECVVISFHEEGRGRDKGEQ
jgi:hypothetical protein